MIFTPRKILASKAWIILPALMLLFLGALSPTVSDPGGWTNFYHPTTLPAPAGAERTYNHPVSGTPQALSLGFAFADEQPTASGPGRIASLTTDYAWDEILQLAIGTSNQRLVMGLGDIRANRPAPPTPPGVLEPILLAEDGTYLYRSIERTGSPVWHLRMIADDRVTLFLTDPSAGQVMVQRTNESPQALSDVTWLLQGDYAVYIVPLQPNTIGNYRVYTITGEFLTTVEGATPEVLRDRLVEGVYILTDENRRSFRFLVHH